MTPRSLRPNKNSSFKKTSDDTASSTIGEFTVTIPPGKLGILLQSSLDGYPKVEDIKLDSPFEQKVQAGDSLISIDGQDLHGYKVEVVSHILDYKKDNETRTFVFSRGN
jgi:C-terminal processing protease CtpA/Prc